MDNEKNLEESHETETDWKAESRKWEARAKKNSKAAEELERLKEAQLSELERANKRAEEAESKLKAFEKTQELEKLRAAVAAKHGVPGNLIAGETEEEMNEWAKRLTDFNGSSSAPKLEKPGKFAKNLSDEQSAKQELADMMFGE